jgi:uncharacterized membrane protein
MIARAMFLISVLASVVGCGEKLDPGGHGNSADGSDGSVTYSQDVAPILDANCIGCHAAYREGADRNGAPVGVDFDTYEAAAESGQAANTRVQAGSMPPPGPLSEEDKETFQAWADGGFPE